jgi:exoribonuclease-2
MNADALHAIAVQAMESRGLLPSFAPEALEEAEHRSRTAPKPATGMRDLRHLPWFSIDNDDTQDMDQLSQAEPAADGAALLRVAIADVVAMVDAAGAMDAHAAANTTSVYTAAGVFPMLPERLSTGLTSLHEGQDRQAVVVEMTIAADGTVAETQLCVAIVRNRARLTYRAVSAWLDGRAPSPGAAADAELQQQLKLHDELATRLRQWRRRRGALNVETVQARPVFDGPTLVDLRADERLRAKDLIADVMIATNSATARFLSRSGFPSLRRFLEPPRRWDRIVELAARHGATLPPAPDAGALDRFLCERRAADGRGFADLSLAVLKLLGSGAYAAEPPGDTAPDHFGLAVTDYTHSTAPNRRYVDLVTQRLIKAALAGDAPPYTLEALVPIAAHCTAQEDHATAVERQVLKAAAAMLLAGRVGEVFDAIVTGTPAKGTFARLSSPLVEGRVVRGFEGLEVGDAVRLRLLATDAAQGHLDFERA